MKKRLLPLLLSLAGLAWPAPLRAQFLGYTSPQTLSIKVFSGQTTAAVTPVPTVNATCTASNGSPCGIQNLGQNVHFLTYTTSGTIFELVIRLEGSIDGTTFFSISDDANNVVSSASSGAVFAVGFYPVIRANLVRIAGGGSVTATYSGTSGTAGNPPGVYNPAQTYQKTVFAGISAGSSSSTTINTPTGSALGYVAFFATGAVPGGSNLVLNGSFGTFGSNTVTLTMAGSSGIFTMPHLPGSSIQVAYNSGGASAVLFDVFYFFVVPGSATGLSAPSVQPLSTTTASQSLNSESTSAVNTAVTKSIAAASISRVHLFSVSARCSAGTAQLQVKDGVGGTVIWSSGTTEVATTTFRFQWSPGLASSSGAGMDIVLGTCGGGNTGTLDVQASQN